MSLDKIVNLALGVNNTGEADNAFRLARKRYAKGERLSSDAESTRELELLSKITELRSTIDSFDFILQQQDFTIDQFKNKMSKVLNRCRNLEVSLSVVTTAGLITALLLIIVSL
jgi:uncharacterized coiled-coil protein SlyX